MSCPTPGNFDICDPKCRCRSGPCQGIAFSCESPCPSGITWDPSTCSCISGGSYKVTTTRTNQANPQNDGTRCYVTYFPDPYFDGSGQSVVRGWFYNMQEYEGYPGAASGFDVISPYGPASGLPLTPGGPPSVNTPLNGSIQSLARLNADYCSNPGIDDGAHNNGIVSFRDIVNNSYLDGGVLVPGGVNRATCDELKTATVTTTVTYLGPGEPTDYYDSSELGGDAQTDYRGILDPQTGLPSCQDPSKSP